jgi:P4 family phage/plasmid primase-like protien
MYSKLFKLLESNKTDEVFHSHVSMIKPKGRYQLNKDKLESFWNEYCKIVESTDNPNLGLAEKPHHYLPVLVDVDIKVKDTDLEYGDQIYSKNHINQIVQIYQTVLRKIIDNIQEEHLICFVLEKPLYKSGDYIKNGFHLHFPYTFLSKSSQQDYLLPKVKKNVEEAKVFADLGFENSGDLIDGSYLKNAWLLYGSKKDESMRPYLLSRILDAEGNDMSLQEALQEYKIFDINDEAINIKNKEEFYLPRIFSVVPNGRKCCEVVSNINHLIKEDNKKNKEKKQIKVYKSESTQEEIKKASELLNFISSDRADNYNDWMDIGWTLYNISEGTEEGLNLWIDFSSRCPEKFDEEKCINEWGKMVKKNKSLGTLKFYASMDSPDEYKLFQKGKQNEFIMKNVASFSHNDIAKYLYEDCGNQYKCASISYNSWYQYENHRWKQIDDAQSLREKISTDAPGSLIDNLKNIQKDLGIKSIDCNDEFEKAKLQGHIKLVAKVISNLKSHPFKTNVIKECKEVFYDELFLKNLDRNQFLVGFKNGVYDLKTFVFREGTPDDYISLQMPFNYQDYSKNDRRVKDVFDFLEKIFPDKSVRDYFLDCTADVFVGGNHQKKVWFWSGEGDNGKSVTQSIFEKMLGQYAVKLPTSLIVGKRTASSSACPELVRAGNGVRWAVLQEPDKKDVVNIGILKELSGNDSFYARGLFKEGGEMEPMFKLVVICNDPPAIPYSDKATWNRIRVIPFESTFCDDAPEDPAEQLRQKRFPIDRNFGEKIPDMVQAFCWVLLEHRKKGGKKVEPEKVTLATNSYKVKNDVYRQFIEECIVEDKDSSLKLAELYAFFKNWYKDGLPNHVVPIKNEVREYFSRLWGDPENLAWKGYKISDINEEIEKGEALLLTKNDLVEYPANLL